jgi:hypothetical protein
MKVGLPPFVKSIAAKVIDAKAIRRKMVISFILILEKKFHYKNYCSFYSEL